MESQSVRKLTTLSLMNLYTNYGRTFIPFRLKLEATPNARCSLGGDPPTGVMPGRVEAAARYLATLGLEDGVDISLLSMFDYASLHNRFNLFRAIYKAHDPYNANVQFVGH